MTCKTVLTALLTTTIAFSGGCLTGPRSSADGGSAKDGSGKTAGPTHLIDNFESAGAANGATWFASADQNNLGSTAEYKVESGGATGAAGHFFGKLGKNAAPWPWASLSIGLKPDNSITDLSAVRAIRMRVKGDGKKYRIGLNRAAVTDYANFAASFSPSAEWTQIDIPLDSMKQADWGKQVPRAWTDVKAIDIQPLDAEKDYDIWIDDIELVLDPSKPSPFAPAPDKPMPTIEGTAFLLDAFEGERPSNGAVWGAEMDMNNLGTLATMRIEPSGDATRKNAAHFQGKLGKSIKPWPWSTLSVNMHPNAEPVSLDAVRGLRFWAKGKGPFRVALSRKAVTDFGHFAAPFNAPAEWKQYTIVRDALVQPDWAAKVPAGWSDVLALQFSPTQNDAPFELWVDDVEFVLDPSKPSPFAKAK